MQEIIGAAEIIARQEGSKGCGSVEPNLRLSAVGRASVAEENEPIAILICMACRFAFSEKIRPVARDGVGAVALNARVGVLRHNIAADAAAEGEQFAVVADSRCLAGNAQRQLDDALFAVDHREICVW